MKKVDMPNTRIFRTREAAEYLGLSVSYLEKLRTRGAGPRFVRLAGRAIGYDVHDLDRWIDGLDPDPPAPTKPAA